MSLAVEQDDLIFRRATIGDEEAEDALILTTFEEDTLEYNIHRNLKEVVERFKANNHEDLHFKIHHEVAQCIRVILKDWQQYKAAVGEDYITTDDKMPSEPKDSFILHNSAMGKLGDDRQKRDSLRYSVAHCFTSQLRMLRENHNFTQETLDSIVAGATKAYTDIVDDASLVSGNQDASSLAGDPQPSKVTYSAELPMPTAKMMAKLTRVPKPNKASKKRPASVSPSNNDEDDAVAVQPPKKKQRPAKKVKPANNDNTTSTEDTGTDKKGSGNHGHGKAVHWTDEEDQWMRDKIREDPQLPFTKLAPLHNARWKGTVFTDTNGEKVTREDRTAGSLQNRFKDFRRGAKEKAKAARAAGEGGEGAANPTAGSITAGDNPPADDNWMVGSTGSEGAVNSDDEEGSGGEDEDEDQGSEEDGIDGQGGSGEEDGGSESAEEEDDKEAEDNDPVGDLEKVEYLEGEGGEEGGEEE